MKAVVRVVVLGSLVSVVACGVRPRTVVQERPSQRSSHVRTPPSTASSYTVVRGDTLYGIAFRHGLDYRELARWNGIAAPYTIYPGQHLRTSEGTRSTVTASRSVPSMQSPAPRVPTTAPATPAPAPVASVPAPVSPPPASSVTPSSPTTPVAAPATPTPAVEAATTPVVATGASRNVQGIAWRWPTTGQIIGRYVSADSTKQGVDVAGNAGQAVVAAADGEVVYSGSGLIGYGELIIVKHSGEFLSAYGHNRARLVREGQAVKAGQQIAEMGRTGASRDMLHFEIRKNGKPVDPLGFLPPK